MKNYLLVFAGLTSCVMRAGAVELTLYVLAKSLFVVLFNRFNRNAYAAE
jgi:hypothetical protein